MSTKSTPKISNLAKGKTDNNQKDNKKILSGTKDGKDNKLVITNRSKSKPQAEKNVLSIQRSTSRDRSSNDKLTNKKINSRDNPTKSKIAHEPQKKKTNKGEDKVQVKQNEKKTTKSDQKLHSKKKTDTEIKVEKDLPRNTKKEKAQSQMQHKVQPKEKPTKGLNQSSSKSRNTRKQTTERLMQKGSRTAPSTKRKGVTPKLQQVSKKQQAPATEARKREQPTSHQQEITIEQISTQHQSTEEEKYIKLKADFMRKALLSSLPHRVSSASRLKITDEQSVEQGQKQDQNQEGEEEEGVKEERGKGEEEDEDEDEDEIEYGEYEDELETADTPAMIKLRNTWHTRMRFLLERGRFVECIFKFLEMRQSVRPDSESYEILIMEACKNGNYEQGYVFLKEMRMSTLIPRDAIWDAFLNCFENIRRPDLIPDLEKRMKKFEKMEKEIELLQPRKMTRMRMRNMYAENLPNKR